MVNDYSPTLGRAPLPGTRGLNPGRFPYNQRKVILRGTRIDVYA
jgi:hypothetical protein